MLAVVQRLTCHGTPLDRWRMTKASTPIAATVSIVSRRLSPLFTLDVPTLNVITSADRRLAAVSNDRRVRVESSKNRLQTVLPRSAGTFGFGRWLTSTIVSVRSSRRSTASGPISAIERRCFIRRPRARRRRRDQHLVGADLDVLVPRRRQVLADEVGPDRQLAVAAVDEHRQLHGPRPPVLGDRVERRPHGAAGEQHVVDEHDGRRRRGSPGCRCGRTARRVAARCRRGTARRRSSRPARPARCARSPRRGAAPARPRRRARRAGRRRPGPGCARGSRGPCGWSPAGCRRGSGPAWGPAPRRWRRVTRSVPRMLLPCGPHGTRFTVAGEGSSDARPVDAVVAAGRSVAAGRRRVPAARR